MIDIYIINDEPYLDREVFLYVLEENIKRYKCFSINYPTMDTTIQKKLTKLFAEYNVTTYIENPKDKDQLEKELQDIIIKSNTLGFAIGSSAGTGGTFKIIEHAVNFLSEESGGLISEQFTEKLIEIGLITITEGAAGAAAINPAVGMTITFGGMILGGIVGRKIAGLIRRKYIVRTSRLSQLPNNTSCMDCNLVFNPV